MAHLRMSLASAHEGCVFGSNDSFPVDLCGFEYPASPEKLQQLAGSAQEQSSRTPGIRQGHVPQGQLKRASFPTFKGFRRIFPRFEKFDLLGLLAFALI